MLLFTTTFDLCCWFIKTPAHPILIWQYPCVCPPQICVHPKCLFFLKSDLDVVKSTSKCHPLPDLYLTFSYPGGRHRILDQADGVGLGGGQWANRIKTAVSAIFFHSKQQKTFIGTLGTQEPTPIGSKPSLGTSCFTELYNLLTFYNAGVHSL